LSLLRQYVRGEFNEDGLEATTLPLHEAEHVEVRVAWGETVLDAEGDRVTFETYPAWIEQRQSEETGLFWSRTPEMVDDVPTRTASTRCYMWWFQ
jgi:hypothetical protein